MKKLSLVLAIAMVVGVGIAYASSIAVPWFVDNAPSAAGLPPSSGVMTIIYLKNNTEEDIVAEISYTSANGTTLDDPATPENEAEYPYNTFVIPAKSTQGFRPVADDPPPSGQESLAANAVPDRPRYTDVNDSSTGQKNGSATISWQGAATDVQGMTATTAANMSYAHLLPSGV